MITVLSVLGTRPEAIKMAPVLRELARCSGEIRSVVCVTAQHRELLDQALALFDIRPDHDLNAMAPGQSLAELAARILAGLDPLIRSTGPDWVVAQGDTTTVLAAALAARHARVRFAHVEAGLRTGDLSNPYPEEMNRRVADGLADLCFAPTRRARANLLAEGVAPERVLVTGNTGIDALLWVAELPAGDPSKPGAGPGPLAGLPADRRIVTVTAHRRESFGEPLREICLAVADLAGEFVARGFHFVVPMHLNPAARGPVGELLSGIPGVSLLEPLGYADAVRLLKRSALVLTDSGGIQEEAPALGVPVLVLRDVTERPEGVEAGAVRLAGRTRSGIREAARRLLLDPGELAAMAVPHFPYGDGHAAGRIVGALLGRMEPWEP